MIENIFDNNFKYLPLLICYTEQPGYLHASPKPLPQIAADYLRVYFFLKILTLLLKAL